MGILRTILIILVVYYALKIIGRFVFPIFMKKMMNNVEKKFNEQQGRTTTKNENVKEGETVVDKAPNTNIKSNNDVGEYVDYEEVE
ncbi:DUF4834 family protein [Aureibaculum sp. 2210JD6-5]|uniref:DUF4834 family protein n=1 Tax=Aureibaculum sp. 2210JD6-5 TaxID=3103957 RepID=UPI002AADF8CC|nr:DUF4834 family protein [Aureibaculum sp. 2210JD6-5]MDY7396598.1 DUF4834 family protein [Aureibaculum sp. 2210JD6-5]